MMIKIFLIIPLFACGSPIELHFEKQSTFVFSEELAESGILAVETWNTATGGIFDPHVLISDECVSTDKAMHSDALRKITCIVALDRVPKCGNDPGPWACYRPQQNRIEVSRKPAIASIAHSLIAHEIGHHLGLMHDDGSIMAEGRDMTTRFHSCISAELASKVQDVVEPQNACAIDTSIPDENYF